MATTTGPLSLFRQAVRRYRHHAALLAGVVLWVVVPAGLISTFFIDPNVDSSLSAYVALMQLALNAAMLYAVVRIVAGQAVSVRAAYYQGSALIVRLVLLTILLLVLTVPLLIALLILSFGVIAPGVTLGSVEKLLMSGLALAVALPGLVVLVRSGWSVFVVAESSVGPIEAVRTSWQLTGGRTWQTLGRVLALAALLAVILALPVAGLTILAALTGSPWLYLLLQVILGLVILPLSTLYLYEHYRSLKA